MRAHTISLIVGLLAGSAPSQTIPVSGGGSALATAILAAPNNAVLQVAPGTYSGMWLTVSKNVTIVAPQGATVSGGLHVDFNGPWQLTVVGLTLLPVAHPYPQPPTGGALETNGNLHAEGCVGPGVVVVGGSVVHVYMRGCTFGGVVLNQLQNVDAVLLDSTFAGHFTQSGYVGTDGLQVTGTLRAERISATGVTALAAGGRGLSVSASAVLVDSQFVGGASGPGQSWAVFCNGPLTLSNCTLNGPASPTPTLRTVPSATWVSSAWTVGGTSQVRFKEAPNEIVAVIASTDLVPWSSPFAAELLYVGLTPNWFVMSLGVTGAGGDMVAPFTIPNVATLQYQPVWLTGAFVDPLPLRTTCPLGGLIQ